MPNDSSSMSMGIGKAIWPVKASWSTSSFTRLGEERGAIGELDLLPCACADAFVEVIEIVPAGAEDVAAEAVEWRTEVSVVGLDPWSRAQGSADMGKRLDASLDHGAQIAQVDREQGPAPVLDDHRARDTVVADPSELHSAPPLAASATARPRTAKPLSSRPGGRSGSDCG